MWEDDLLNALQPQKTVHAVRLATMTGKQSAMVGNLKLTADDLLIAEHVANDLKKGDLVFITRISESKFAILGKVGS